MRDSDGASTVAAWNKRDSRGTVLVDVPLSDAGGAKADETSREPAATSSSKPQEHWFSGVSGASGRSPWQRILVW